MCQYLCLYSPCPLSGQGWTGAARAGCVAVTKQMRRGAEGSRHSRSGGSSETSTIVPWTRLRTFKLAWHRLLHHPQAFIGAFRDAHEVAALSCRRGYHAHDCILAGVQADAAHREGAAQRLLVRGRLQQAQPRRKRRGELGPRVREERVWAPAGGSCAGKQAGSLAGGTTRGRRCTPPAAAHLWQRLADALLADTALLRCCGHHKQARRAAAGMGRAAVGRLWPAWWPGGMCRARLGRARACAHGSAARGCEHWRSAGLVQQDVCMGPAGDGGAWATLAY